MRSANDFLLLGQYTTSAWLGWPHAGAVPQGWLGPVGSVKGTAGKHRGELMGFWEKGSSFPVVLAVSLRVRPTCGPGSVLRILQPWPKALLGLLASSWYFPHRVVSV